MVGGHHLCLIDLKNPFSSIWQYIRCYKEVIKTNKTTKIIII